MVNLINVKTMTITQTFSFPNIINEIKRTSKEWVFVTEKGIKFIKYDSHKN